jgi:hypothetical protein
MYIKRLSEIFVLKAFLILRYKVLKFIVDQKRLPDSPIRGIGDSPTRRYWEPATPRLTDTESRRLPDSPMRGVGESTKGKIKALDLYVCLLLQASRVQQKNVKRCRLQH